VLAQRNKKRQLRNSSGDMLAAVFSRSLTSISLLIVLAATLTAGGGGAMLDYPEPKGYVNDFANVIDAQSAIVTIQDLGGAPLEHYATSLFNKWEIGYKVDNRGILILLALSDHKFRIEVGRGFEALFPHERVAGINAEMVPDLKLQHYGQEVLRGTRSLAKIVAQERGVKLDELKSSSTP
jgi:uncharacterized protein